MDAALHASVITLVATSLLHTCTQQSSQHSFQSHELQPHQFCCILCLLVVERGGARVRRHPCSHNVTPKVPVQFFLTKSSYSFLTCDNYAMQEQSQDEARCALALIVFFQDGVAAKLWKWQQDDGLLQKLIFDICFPSCCGGATMTSSSSGFC